MEKRTTYVACDGSEFDNEQECVDHENKIKTDAAILRSDVDIYDGIGVQRDMDNPDWHLTAEEIVIKSEAGKQALIRVLNDSDNSVCNFYDPDLARGLEYESAPLILRYMDGSTSNWCLGGFRSRLEPGWYDVNRILKSLHLGNLAIQALKDRNAL